MSEMNDTTETGEAKKPRIAEATASQDSPSAAEEDAGMSRRFFLRVVGFSWAHFLVICGFFGAWFTRFLFPNVRYEPPFRFKIGKPEDFLPDMIDTRFKKRYGVWIVRTGDRIVVLSTVCTHLGCTPNWLVREEKFKCPCHGSGFNRQGINFEGPAPRPLDRYKVTLDNDGIIVVDKSVVFRKEAGQWNLSGSFISL